MEGWKGGNMKVGKIIYNIISTFILIVVIALAILLVLVRLVGYTPYAVLSGSMEPLYSVGSTVYVKSVEAEDIEVGDVITFTMADGSTVVTHEVVEIDEEMGQYYTKGLANDTQDGAPTTIDHIIGEVHFGIPYLGYISSYITTPPWIYIIICLALIWILLLYMVETWEDEKHENPEGRAENERAVRKNVRRRGPRAHRKNGRNRQTRHRRSSHE